MHVVFQVNFVNRTKRFLLFQPLFAQNHGNSGIPDSILNPLKQLKQKGLLLKRD